jgi:hypothetical protein
MDDKGKTGKPRGAKKTEKAKPEPKPKKATGKGKSRPKA